MQRPIILSHAAAGAVLIIAPNCGVGDENDRLLKAPAMPMPPGMVALLMTKREPSIISGCATSYAP